MSSREKFEVGDTVQVRTGEGVTGLTSGSFGIITHDEGDGFYGGRFNYGVAKSGEPITERFSRSSGSSLRRVPKDFYEEYTKLPAWSEAQRHIQALKLDRKSYRIYVASSWRNKYQPGVVERLRADGHTVYDFRNPTDLKDPDSKPVDAGFSWREIDDNWENWSPEQYRDALKHPFAKRGYYLDRNALDAAEMTVLVLPSGRSASWEAGYAAGQKQMSVVYIPEKCEPELMYRNSYIVTSMDELSTSILTGDVWLKSLERLEKGV